MVQVLAAHIARIHARALTRRVRKFPQILRRFLLHVCQMGWEGERGGEGGERIRWERAGSELMRALHLHVRKVVADARVIELGEHR